LVDLPVVGPVSLVTIPRYVADRPRFSMKQKIFSRYRSVDITRNFACTHQIPAQTKFRFNAPLRLFGSPKRCYSPHYWNSAISLFWLIWGRLRLIWLTNSGFAQRTLSKNQWDSYHPVCFTWNALLTLCHLIWWSDCPRKSRVNPAKSYSVLVSHNVWSIEQCEVCRPNCFTWNVTPQSMWWTSLR